MNSPAISSQLSALSRRPEVPTKARIAIERLLRVAFNDTGQSRMVANFLLAWWNAAECGGFDLTDLWAVDAEIALDMFTVFSLVSTLRYYPDALGYKQEFSRVWEQWRGNGGVA